MSSSNTKVAPLAWAQRKDKIYLKFTIAEASDVSLKQTEEKLSFSCKNTDGDTYAFEFEFYRPVKGQSEWKNTGRAVELKIMKKDEDTDYWPKLYKGSTKYRNVTVDWSRWIDEDEEEADSFDWGSGQELSSSPDEMFNQMQQQKLLEQLQNQVKQKQSMEGGASESDGLDDLDDDDEEEDEE